MASKEDLERLFALLVGCTRPWIEWPDHAEHWITYSRGQLTPSRLGVGHPVGILPGRRRSRWAAIDIDHKPNKVSQYHPQRTEDGIDKIIAILAKNGLEGVVRIQSSTSKGIHLWMPVPEQKTTDLAQWLHSIFANEQCVISQGTLELFPNTPRKGASYKAIRVPLLSPGSWVLDEDLFPIHQDIGSLCDELERALWINSEFMIRGQPEVPHDYFHDIPQARSRLEKGFTGPGQTDKLAMDAAYIGAYEGLKGAALRTRMCNLLKNAPNAQKHSSHYKEIERGTYDSWWRFYSSKSRTWRESQREVGACKKAPNTNPSHNSEKSARARMDLERAAETLTQQGLTYPHITAARKALVDQVHQLGGTMSINTVRKHDDISLSLIGTESSDEARARCEPSCSAVEFTPASPVQGGESQPTAQRQQSLPPRATALGKETTANMTMLRLPPSGVLPISWAYNRFNRFQHFKFLPSAEKIFPLPSPLPSLTGPRLLQLTGSQETEESLTDVKIKTFINQSNQSAMDDLRNCA